MLSRRKFLATAGLLTGTVALGIKPVKAGLSPIPLELNERLQAVGHKSEPPIEPIDNYESTVRG